MGKTIKNLAFAFIGESQARNRYTRYAKIAKKEGYEAIAANFDLTANQEAEHAKWLMRMINQLKGENTEDDDEIIVESASVSTVLGSTKENLQAAIKGENYENSEMYPDFAEVAEEEGYMEIAQRLRSIAQAEKNHEERYQQFLKDLKEGKLFLQEEEVVWQCRQCGYIYKGKKAPDECPSCGHPQAYFEIKK
jgi:rubrerythrin